MIIDTSALIAILFGEPETESFVRALADDPKKMISAFNALESAIVIEAKHMCMMMRGVQKQNSVTTTSAFTGIFENVETRTEFLNLVQAKLH